MAHPQYLHFDIYLTGAAEPGESRAALIKKLAMMYRLDRNEVAAFITAGQRIRVRRGIDQDGAMRTLAELQKLGAQVEVEPNRPPEAALSALDVFQSETAASADPPAHAVTPADVLRHALVSLDGSPTDETRGGRDTSTVSSEPRTQPYQVAALDSVTDPFSPLELPVEAPTHPGGADRLRNLPEVAFEPTRAAPPPSDDDARFRSPDLGSGQFEITVDLPPPPPQPEPSPDADDSEPVPRCEAHDEPEPCATCAQESAPRPGRIMQGALRQKPAMRLMIGVVLGFGIGYLASLPYANRAERRVAEVRAEANLDRYKNAPELRANTARLDQKAEEMSTKAAYVTIAIWLVLGGAVLGGWFRAT